jgi:hypothetical protein
MTSTYPTNDKSGVENLVAFVLAVREKCATLTSNQGDLTTLTTTDKTSLVKALIEVVASIEQVKKDLAAKTEISDTTQTKTNTWSAVKIADSISTAASNLKNEILNGAGEAYDTLKELGDLIDTNKDAITALETIASGHVKFDGAQTLTDAQKTQARSNISAANVVHTHAIADITGLQTLLDTLATKEEVGDTTVDLADIFANGVTE